MCFGWLFKEALPSALESCPLFNPVSRRGGARLPRHSRSIPVSTAFAYSPDYYCVGVLGPLADLHRLSIMLVDTVVLHYGQLTYLEGHMEGLVS